MPEPRQPESPHSVVEFDPQTVPISPAATIMLVRDCTDVHDIEVFLLRRNMDSVFGGGMYVFPGGRLDEGDRAADAAQLCDGLSDERASAQLGVDTGGLAYWVAALRECFEEAGVLLARNGEDGDVVRFDDPVVQHRFEAARHHVHDGSMGFIDFCRAEGVRLMTDEVRYVSHWTTPVGGNRRFSTRFFLAAAPPLQHPLHDDGETIASLWVRPSVAMRQVRDAELHMMPPTVASLRFLRSFTSVTAALSATQGFPGDTE